MRRNKVPMAALSIAKMCKNFSLFGVSKKEKQLKVFKVNDYNIINLHSLITK